MASVIARQFFLFFSFFIFLFRFLVTCVFIFCFYFFSFLLSLCFFLHYLERTGERTTYKGGINKYERARKVVRNPLLPPPLDPPPSPPGSPSLSTSIFTTSPTPANWIQRKLEGKIQIPAYMMEVPTHIDEILRQLYSTYDRSKIESDVTRGSNLFPLSATST